jgi:hypothetical protein
MDDSVPNSLPAGRDLVGGALRGAVAAMAMTGMRTAERAALAIDHLLYGLILSEGRDRG